MLQHRVSGVLLHPTSLPGPYGIGDLGSEAFRFVDWLVSARQSLWQVLPLGPTGYGDSPYAARSSYAGNPLLISLDRLVEAGDLTADEARPNVELSEDRVWFGNLIQWKMPLLRYAAGKFLDRASVEQRNRFDQFCHEERSWLDDYALYTALKRHFESQPDRAGGSMWNVGWDQEIARHEPAAISVWRQKLWRDVQIEQVLQFRFFEQWRALRSYANERGVKIIGDVPIFVALDSADVWAEPEMFRLDSSLQPTHVAGVPPDYFSETGQRWGNPLYAWDRMQQDGFRWWLRRMAGTRSLVDIVRVDHFRGFEANWSIPADQPNAILGEWTPAPGAELFTAMRREFGELPILAEDLGLITQEVEDLRDANGFPGMRVLQFAFGALDGEANSFLPCQHVPNCVVYTGTHDNDTIRGWWETREAQERRNILDYIGHEPQDMAWEFVRMAMASVGKIAIVPLQDVLGLGGEARMNRPSVESGNWDWRVTGGYDHHDSAARMADLVRVYIRDEERQAAQA